MNTDIDGLWLTMAVVTGAVGGAMFVYGVKQKDPLPLAFGVVISAIPMVVSSGWAAAGLTVGAVILFFMLRRNL